MKAWLARFGISTALDRESGRCGASTNPRRRSSEAGPFEASIKALEARLRAARPCVTVPEDLHGCIMRAVRAEAGRKEPVRAPAVWRMLPVPVTAVAVALGVWWFAVRLSPIPEVLPSPAFTAAAAVLEQSHQWPARASGAALSPLAQELELLRRDVRGAMEFLLASVP